MGSGGEVIVVVGEELVVVVVEDVDSATAASVVVAPSVDASSLELPHAAATRSATPKRLPI
jgi:hypothetical protein